MCIRDRASAGSGGEYTYTASVPAGLLWANTINVQVEGCRKADIQQSGGGDWIKAFGQLRIAPNAKAQPVIREATGPGDAPVKLYFSIHKHMHQPYYNATDRLYWDGEKDGIFGARGGPYTHFIPTAVRQYIGGGLPHAGLSLSCLLYTSRCV